MMHKLSLPLSRIVSCQKNEAGPILSANAEEWIRRTTILAVLYLLPAIWILQPVILDPDIWWHLRAGKWIVEHGTFPTTDPFSIYGEGKPWVAYSWLFEVGMYGLLRVFGETGIIVYTLVGTWLIMLMLHWIIGRRCSDFVSVFGLLATSIIALSNMFTPRPWLLTILFFAITLHVVLSFRDGKDSKVFWLLPMVYVVWANIHIQFIYGLGLLGLACVAPLIDQLAQPFVTLRSATAWGDPRWKQLVSLTVLCVLGTLATPYHASLYSVVAMYANQTGLWEFVQELHAPGFRSLANWALLGLFSFVLVKLGRRTSCSSFEVLLLLAAGGSAFRSQRDTWFLVLACLAIVVSEYSQPDKRQRTNLFPALLRTATVIVLLIIGVLGIVRMRDFSDAKIHQNTGIAYPIQAATFVEQQGYKAPIYNHFDWGGYLIWRLPQLKVSMDGRTNVHGEERTIQSLKTWNGGSHWSEDLELDGAEVVIAKKDMALSSLLRFDHRFQKTYEDENAIVFVRVRDEAGQSGLSPLGMPPLQLPPGNKASAHQVALDSPF